MKRNKIALAGTALFVIGALALAGCASGGNESNGDAGGNVNADAIITTNGSEPENPLIPTNTNEVGGGKILDEIFAGLIYYDAEGKPVNDVAEEITTEDPQNLTIKIKEGLTFTDGEEVTADNFIKAWNEGAKLSNGHLSSYFFEDIEGFSYDEDSELTGLKQVDDYTFTIALNKPASDFALRLGYSAFYPLPDVAFEDMDAFGQNPIATARTRSPTKTRGSTTSRSSSSATTTTTADARRPTAASPSSSTRRRKRRTPTCCRTRSTSSTRSRRTRWPSSPTSSATAP